MDHEIKNEFVAVRKELLHLSGRMDVFDQRFESIDQRFESIDQRFESIDQRFESIDQRIQSESRIVHASINKLATDFQSKCLADEQFQKNIFGMFDTIISELRDARKIPAIEKQVANHDMRISNLEVVVRKS